MAFRTTPSLGPDLDQASTQFYFQDDASTPTYQLGTRVHGSDGFEYVFVKAGSSDIPADTQVEIDGTTYVATAGSGGFYAPVDVPANGYFHARKGSDL